MKKGEYYYLGQDQYIKNEQIFYARASETILDKVAASVTQERKRNMVQFCTMLHFLSQRQPMADFIASKDLFMALNVLHLPRKHCFEPTG